ncbi:MAG TPA: hypothetical protein VNM69_08245 [Bacillus sp. (in: firmicutes)]|nr:hypothetical protein [Bacillus sp. (in: firmicutes)]
MAKQLSLIRQKIIEDTLIYRRVQQCQGRSPGGKRPLTISNDFNNHLPYERGILEFQLKDRRLLVTHNNNDYKISQGTISSPLATPD